MRRHTVISSDENCKDESSLKPWQQPLIDPLPLEVARAWGFPLDHIISPDGKTYYFNLRQWLAGCVDDKYADMTIRNMRRRDRLSCIESTKVQTVRVNDGNGRPADEHYVTDDVLYLLTQDIRSTEKRSQTSPVDAIKEYLAASGAFMDKERRKEELTKLKTQQAITAYQLQGHSIDWAKFRVDGKETHKALATTIKDTHNTHSAPDYGRIFGAQHQALFNKAKSVIVEELGLTPTQANNLRDYLGNFALDALRSASTSASARMKREARPLTDAEQVEIVSNAARIIAPGMKALAEYAGVDFISGDPLDASGHRVRITQGRMLNGGAK